MKTCVTIILSLVLLFSFAWVNKIEARRLVKIATIGAVPPYLDETLTYQQKVEQMILFLKREINQVLPDHPDLIVLPEACDRPSGLKIKQQFEYFKVRGAQVQNFLASVAQKNNCYIAFGMKRKDDKGLWRNSCIILNRAGKIAGIYNKNFPTPGEMEAGIVAGNQTPIIKTDFGRIGCAICFDLNFDELRARYARQKPDLIIFPSMYHGGLVQAEWAYACRAYFVSSIGVGNLPSEIRNPLGQVIATTTNYFDHIVATVNLDYELAHLDNNWKKLDALKKKYGDKVVIYDPGEIGVVMIISESDEISAAEMVREFKIELVDHYFNRTRAMRLKSNKMK